MKIESKVINDTTIVYLEGPLVFNVLNDVKGTIEKLRTASPDNSLMLDLEKVNRLDSTGIGLIVTTYRKVACSEKARFGIINPSEIAEQILESVGFTRLAKIYRSEEEALKAE